MHIFVLVFNKDLSFREFQPDLRKLMDFILDAVLTVSPNRQYRGRMEPTIPAIQGPVRNCSKIVNCEQKNYFSNVLITLYQYKPELTPILSSILLSPRMVNCLCFIRAKRSKANVAISPACLSLFRFGKPEKKLKWKKV